MATKSPVRVFSPLNTVPKPPLPISSPNCCVPRTHTHAHTHANVSARVYRLRCPHHARSAPRASARSKHPLYHHPRRHRRQRRRPHPRPHGAWLSTTRTRVPSDGAVRETTKMRCLQLILAQVLGPRRGFALHGRGPLGRLDLRRHSNGASETPTHTHAHELDGRRTSWFIQSPPLSVGDEMRALREPDNVVATACG